MAILENESHGAAPSHDAPKMIDGVELTPKVLSMAFAPRQFDTVADERRERKQKLAGALRIF
ncbi:MAG TPA: hypothetical protein PLV68_08885, partial [Ilumatobacteraceae bacterium]|nr:hypothetical protein [Ilumatobacteraceae bacterium]